jgi:hypothetical protein
VIGAPFNDLRCLGAITEVAADLVAEGDEVIMQLAGEHASTEALAAWIRSLPQRDDLGERGDGPKMDTCDPPQRLRIPAPDPNCVERAALYLAVAELIDAQPVRQLATLDTPIGLHTFPIENGAPVILDPRVPRNCLDCGMALFAEGPIAISPRDAVEWTAQLAESGAAAMRNGPSRVHQARNAMMRLVDHGKAPATPADIDGMAWLLTLAERVARRYGPRALAIVRSTAQAISELADEAMARAKRNVSLEIGGRRPRPAPWLSALARIAGRVGTDVGEGALRAKLASLGVPPQLLGLVEKELKAEGVDLRSLTAPRRPTFADMAMSRTA